MGIPIGKVGGLLRNLAGGVARAAERDWMAGAIRAGVSPRSILRPDAPIQDVGKALVNTRTFQGSAAGMVGTALNPTGIENALNQIGPAIDRTVSNIIPSSIRNPLNQFASEQEKKGFGGALDVAAPLGFLVAPFIPNTSDAPIAAAANKKLNGIQTGKYGPTDWNPSANPLVKRGEQQAADRNYQAEKARIAQQTAQNPLFQKYQVADLTKQYNTASSPAEKQRIGLEIWAQTNPLLAAKLKSGQVGYAESRTAPGMSNAGGMPISGLPMPTTQFDLTNAVSTPSTMEQNFGTPVPGFGMVSATPQVFNPGAVQGPLSDGMIQSSYQQQLLSAPDFAKAAKDSAFLRQAYQQQGLK